MAPASKAQQRAVAKYMQQNYDEIKVRVPKGKKDLYRNHAEQRGESLNGFMNRAAEEAVQRDSALTIDRASERDGENHA